MTYLHDPTLVVYGQVLLALVFSVAGAQKLRQREEFVGIVRNFRILPPRVAEPAARLLPFAELALAAALLVPTLLQVTGGVAFLLLAIFSLAVAVNLVRGRQNIDCGCFRTGAGQHLSWWMVARNLGLMGLALLLATKPATAAAPGLLDLITASLAAAVTALLYVAATQIRVAASLIPAAAHAHAHHHEVKSS
ncbi:MauE/DoxX family redox-associated membrane protein [Indioceanicola profundi]|uniref:MauE/DoxX family redox-associated membrane protein n=1 Tax=Indioceanicola profundi TaxID=2220096 RepID=UPI000E6ADCC5|nr:MauE/DoxX family redox-associated membrane protein [Indioceanicola profundi]